MTPNQLIAAINRDLKKKIDPRYKEAQEWYFKSEFDCYGVRIGDVRDIGKKYWKEMKEHSKEDIFKSCDELLKTGKHEHLIIAFLWARNLKDQLTVSDFKKFESWVKKYITNWAACDDFCSGALAHLLMEHPELIKKTEAWRTSKNVWVRRASAVCLIVPIRKEKKHLDEIFQTAKTLLEDKEDMVQKGYGWMLKEASNHYPKDVFDFVMKNKKRMPRTALRYAIEKLSTTRKKQAMK